MVAGLLASSPAQGQTYRVLHAFTGGTDGETPYFSTVVHDAAGNFYGMTPYGGAFGAGIVFKLDRAGKETVFHTFGGGKDGSVPFFGLIADAAGNLYGATAGGGVYGSGTVFKLSAAGRETLLYSFTGMADGGSPDAVVRDTAGNLYGGTAGGANPSCTFGCGTVFELDTTGKLTVLHSFTGVPDGFSPQAPFILDVAGNLYGTTAYGGDPACNGGAGCGTVFKVDTAGTETILHSFSGGIDGGYSPSGLVLDGAGNLYGTTAEGGANGAGVVFEIDNTGTESVLYSFTGGADGFLPFGGVLMDAAGNFYGTTYSGGAYGYGTIFEVDSTGVETVLHSFAGAEMALILTPVYSGRGGQPLRHYRFGRRDMRVRNTVRAQTLTCGGARRLRWAGEISEHLAAPRGAGAYPEQA